MSDHDNEKLFKCETCGICFTQKNSLEEHVNTHLCQKPFKCNECGETFTKKFYLSVHIKSVHRRENTKTFDCLLCPEVFPSKYYLNVHLGEHGTENLFKCETCGKSFALKSKLNEHKKTTHLGKKRFKCDQCGKKFTRKYYLSVHIKSGHKNDRCILLKCHICKKEFKNKTNLKLHVKEHAKPECPLCFQPTEECACSWNRVDDKCDRLKNRFARENLMIRCQTCSKPILRNSQLKIHLRIHRDYKCILCNEDYKNCNCCDDYMEVSKTINTYRKTSKPSTSVDEALPRKASAPSVAAKEDEISTPDEEKPVDEAIVPEDEKCMACDEDCNNSSSSDEYMEVTKSVKTYQKASKSLIKAKKEERFTPIDEPPVKESAKFSENIIPKDGKCIIFNEDNDESCFSDDYMQVTKSVNTYQKINKSSINANEPLAEKNNEPVNVKEEEISASLVNDCSTKIVELSETIVPKEEPKQEHFEIPESSIELFAEVDEDAKIFDVKPESIEFPNNLSLQLLSISFKSAVERKSKMSKENDSSFQCAFEKAVEVMKSTDTNELKGRIECEICKGIFLKRHHFNNHLCKKKSKKMCPICQKTFLSPYRLNEHLYLHSGEKPYECEVCKKRFSQKGYLSKHSVIHRKEKPFKCNFCNKSYTQADTLKEHIYTHTGEKPLKCRHCDKSFSNKSSYNLHISIHESTKTYECDVCLKQFTQKYYLKRHRNIHAFEKPYKCDVCGKSFSLKAGLNEHMYCHSGEKPYKCDECDKSFTRRTTLSMHREMHNAESSKLPKCHVCNKRFMNKFLLERHIGVHRKFKCLVCDKSSKICICTPEVDQNALQGPVSKKDMFKCQACSKIVFNRSFFMEHIAVHRDFKCLDCDGIYASCGCFKPSMEDFEMVEDDLKCSLCDMQFFHEAHLYEHLLNHKCMVCCTSMMNCVCPKEEDDELHKQNNQIIKCKPLEELKSSDSGNNIGDENSMELIKQEYDDFQKQHIDFEQGPLEYVDEDLEMKEAFSIEEDKPKLEHELIDIGGQFVEMTSGDFVIDNKLVEADQKPVTISEEFVVDDNDFKPEYIKLELKPMELADLILNSDNFLE
ncbi:zinc finger protein 624-like [Agrilus planipennis]|uniref:Zinc finger protein 865 n=1 Tax=Agrilus planipennis TaxID=224129 RepID=A0A1W4W2P4_AGRPL|nr:zinc finger protein 624-like [Agrilus planipennis]